MIKKIVKKKQVNVDGNTAKAFDLSLHSKEIKEYLETINLDPWYYIYEKYVNPFSKKKRY